MDKLVNKSLSANPQQIVAYRAVQQPNSQLTLSKQEIAVRERLSIFQTLTSYSLSTFAEELSADNVPVKGLNDHLPKETNPLVKQDRDKAIEKINNLLVKVNKLKAEYKISEEAHPICPYEQTKLEYLGPNYIVPSIHDLPEPVEFSAEVALNSNLLIQKQLHENMITQMQMMSAQTANPDFSGSPSEVFGHAFTKLSATATGEQLVVDRHKTALHLEFAELVRNIPSSYILENPLLVAQKIINRYIEINKESLKQQLIALPE
jgi:hypothetical protein